MTENSLDKASEIGKISAVGSFQLFVGKTASTLILAVGTIILTLFVLPTDYGLYAIATIPATTMLLFQDWGVGAAMTRYTAQYRATNRGGELRRIITAGLTFEVGTGLILTVVTVSIANFLASTVFGKPESAFPIALASVTIFSTSITNATQSVIVGFERMKLISSVMVCQGVVQSTLCPLLVYLGYGAPGVVLGYTAGSLAASVVSTCMFYFVIFRKLDPDFASKPDLTQTLKHLLQYGVPLAIGTLVGGSQLQFYSLVMASFCSTTMIGNYKTASNFAVLLSLLVLPISTVLFPAFSKIDPRREKQLLKSVFTSSVKYTAFLLLPATFAFVVLSKPLIATLYGNKWPYAPLFLALYVLSNLLIVFGNLSLNTLLGAVGETKLLMKLYMLTFAIGVPLAFLLIPSMGIVGLLILVIADGIPSMFIGLFLVWKRYETKVDLTSSTKMLFASAIAAAITYLLLNALNMAEWAQLATGIVLFLAVYLSAVAVVGAINQTDIKNLRNMISGLGLISKLLNIPLTITEKLLDIRNQRKPARYLS